MSHPDFDLEIYRLYNNLEAYSGNELYNHWKNIGSVLKFIYNEKMIYNKYPDLNLSIYKELNKDLYDMSNKELLIHWISKGRHENRISSLNEFYKKYGHKDIKMFKNCVYDTSSQNIYEVLNDLSQQKPVLEKGISLIIRAKNEELNIKDCIESVIDLVDEIMFVDNYSTDSTYSFVNKYTQIHRKIKLYKYNIKVNRVGIEHSNSLKNNDKNTLGTFYNWCLSKATKNIVFKWDADFICIRNNFLELLKIYDLRNREDKIAIWFTGKTLFENKNKYYLNYQSFYNEYRIFSYKNGFKWYDGEICEYTEPYLTSCNHNKKYVYPYPLFYEMKRTSINEFEERSSLIDSRDINDMNIINKLGSDKHDNLIFIDKNYININKKIIIITPSLSLGGGNQFVINMYYVLKTFGYKVCIIPINKISVGKDKFANIIQDDIIDFGLLNDEFLDKYKPDFILFNSVYIPMNLSKYKLLFVSHSDVAYANSYIKKYHSVLNKIITVNQYTINKLSKLLDIPPTDFYKIINYSDIKINVINTKILKKRKFGVITRFSEDKNIPMLLYSLVEIFKSYPNYKCYLVGTHNEMYDNYLIALVRHMKIDKFISFEGYQSNTKMYYEMFDFIILPSVSEGCSYNIIEAMTYGVPIVLSDVGGNHELITDDTNGLLFKYSGIRDLEERTVYIDNYNEHLQTIGYIIEKYGQKFWYTEEMKFLEAFLIDAVCPIYAYSDDSIKYAEIKKKQSTWLKNADVLTYNIDKMINLSDAEIHQFIQKNINFIDSKFNENIYVKQILELFK